MEHKQPDEQIERKVAAAEAFLRAIEPVTSVLMFDRLPEDFSKSERALCRLHRRLEELLRDLSRAQAFPTRPVDFLGSLVSEPPFVIPGANATVKKAIDDFLKAVDPIVSGIGSISAEDTTAAEEMLYGVCYQLKVVLREIAQRDGKTRGYPFAEPDANSIVKAAISQFRLTAGGMTPEVGRLFDEIGTEISDREADAGLKYVSWQLMDKGRHEVLLVCDVAHGRLVKIIRPSGEQLDESTYEKVIERLPYQDGGFDKDVNVCIRAALSERPRRDRSEPTGGWTEPTFGGE